jgi:hypothetical protein
MDCPGFTPEAVVKRGNLFGTSSERDPIINNLLFNFFIKPEKSNDFAGSMSTLGAEMDEKSGSSYCPCIALYIFRIESQKRIKGIERFRKA